jgi:hypothetical protein
MAITCIIEGCGNRQEKQVEGKKCCFISYLRMKPIEKKWLENIANSSCGLKKNLKTIGGKSCVCSEHFHDSDYILGVTGMKRLNYKLAIPFSRLKTSCKVNIEMN